MTDKAFERLIRKTADACTKHMSLLRDAEREYERRYGNNPSDVDDDYWIDSLHGCAGDAVCMTVAQVDEHAKIHKKMKPGTDRPPVMRGCPFHL